MGFEPGAAEPVAAFEMADPRFAAGSVAGEAALRSSGSGLLAAGAERPSGSNPSSGFAGGARPSRAATSRGEIPDPAVPRRSGSDVSSDGLPISLLRGRSPGAHRSWCSR